MPSMGLVSLASVVAVAGIGLLVASWLGAPPLGTIQQEGNATDAFVKGWSTYQACLRGDYLEHRILYDAVYKELYDFRINAARPLKMADLGSGDSDYLMRYLKAMQAELGPNDRLLDSYEGVDLSQPALDIGRDNLAANLDPATKVDLKMQDFVSWAESKVSSISDPALEGYDVIFMSYALHHLEADGKVRMMELFNTLLRPKGGVVLLVDVFRPEGESIAGWGKRFAADVQTNWLEMTQHQKDFIVEHATGYDIPETFSTYKDWSSKVGFTHAEVVQVTTRGFGAFMRFDTHTA